MKGVTDKQLEALRLVKRGSDIPGDLIDFDQLLEGLSWTPTKQSAQFTIRALIAKGFIKKDGQVLRRGRQRVTYRMTKEGKLLLDPRPEPVSEPLPFIPELSKEANPDVFEEVKEVVLPG